MPLPDFTAFDTALAELQGESDRARAVVGASVIETLLGDLLKKALLPTTAAARLLRKDGPVGSLSARIDLAKSMAILPIDVCDDLHLVRQIRNKFAHSHEPLRFDLDPIRSWVSSFRCLVAIRNQLKERKTKPEEWAIVVDKGWHLPRRQFEVAVFDLSGRLSVSIHHRAPPVTPPNAY